MSQPGEQGTAAVESAGAVTAGPDGQTSATDPGVGSGNGAEPQALSERTERSEASDLSERSAPAELPELAGVAEAMAAVRALVPDAGTGPQVPGEDEVTALQQAHEQLRTTLDRAERRT